jgi:SAM-dependent methyltransferase
MQIIDKEYWDTRYKSNEIGWDIGYVSTPIKEYLDQLNDKSLDILIPGCGSAWEAEYCLQQGFKNTHAIDISDQAVSTFQKRVPDFPKENIFNDDFFTHSRKYDLIIEQTFFCALPPTMRTDYVKKMHELLKPNGKLVGLLFNIELFEYHPPFGGHQGEYQKLFAPYFHIKIMDTAFNSIPPRADNELFVILEKKQAYS